jgi:peptidoglycan-associated lipoprotein
MRFVVVLTCMLLAAACARQTPGDPSLTGAGANGGISAQGLGGAGSYAPGSQAALQAEAGDTIYFAFDSSQIRPESEAVLRQQAAWLQANPGVRVSIEGHTDERGTREYNLALGERRAAAVRSYLIGLGVAPDRVRTVSYGEERPAVMGNDERAFALNRRAVTVVAATS